MSSRRKHRKSSMQPVEALLEGFTPVDRRRLGITDSAHKVAVGTYEGQKVAVKPFRSKRGLVKARNEFATTRSVFREGFQTVEPIDVIDLKRHRVALLISKYIHDLIGAHTLTFEAEPDTQEGRALQPPLRKVATQLGKLHDRAITHGDPQIKNFGFLSPAVVNSDVSEPYVLDFENGIIHTANDGQFQDQAADDVGRLMYSLGGRQFGGRSHKTAADVAREVVVGAYLESPAAEVLGSAALPRIVDHAQENFMSGRRNKHLVDNHHVHDERVRASLDTSFGTRV